MDLSPPISRTSRVSPLSRATATSPAWPTTIGTFDTPPVVTPAASIAFCHAAGTATSQVLRIVGAAWATLAGALVAVEPESGELVHADAATVRAAMTTARISTSPS
jgi:hypothetical protein